MVIEEDCKQSFDLDIFCFKGYHFLFVFGNCMFGGMFVWGTFFLQLRKKAEKVMVRAVGFHGRNCIMGLVGFRVSGIACDFSCERCLGRPCWPFYAVSRRTEGSKILD